MTTIPAGAESNGRQAVFDIATGAIVVPDGALDKVSPLMPRGYVDVLEASKAGYASTTLTTGDKNNISPRIGFAWRPSGGNQSVIRGSAGIFYDASAVGPSAGSTVPFLIAEPSFTNPIENPIVLPTVFPTSGSGGPSTVALPPAFRPDLRIPRSMQYSLTFERQQWETGFPSVVRRNEHAPGSLSLGYQFAGCGWTALHRQASPLSTLSRHQLHGQRRRASVSRLIGGSGTPLPEGILVSGLLHARQRHPGSREYRES